MRVSLWDSGQLPWSELPSLQYVATLSHWQAPSQNGAATEGAQSISTQNRLRVWHDWASLYWYKKL